ncbi:MAG TPA: hypothetical protein PKK39_04660 [Tepidiformaceae bacterium]|nr:hypothetical protein [Tepidiformaceae bacterium]
MDLFDLFDFDGPENDRRRNGENAQEPPRKGVRGFFQRWMASFRDEDDDYGRRDGDRDRDRRKRQDNDFGWD